MGKQLEFNQLEQDFITNAIMTVCKILLEKMDDGVTAPQLSGTVEIENDNRIVTWDIKAKRV